MMINSAPHNSKSDQRGRLVMDLARESLQLKEPFRISGHVFEHIDVLRVTLSDDEHQGRGEAAGVYNLNDRPAGMEQALRERRGMIEKGLSRAALRDLLPPGGARNALDCALWELEAQRAGAPVWELANTPQPGWLQTTFTLSAKEPELMAQDATAWEQARRLKLKLTGELVRDVGRVRAVRQARPDVWLAVDANQGYEPETLRQLLPALEAFGVNLLEQPFKRGRESYLDLVQCRIPIAADESVQGLDEIDALKGRFDLINIKLDKCGGLTEGLRMAERARELGMGVMVGNMIGTSLAMAPAFVLGQLCDVVDLDGPTFLAQDCVPGVSYEGGALFCPENVWGWSAPARRA